MPDVVANDDHRQKRDEKPKENVESGFHFPFYGSLFFKMADVKSPGFPGLLGVEFVLRAVLALGNQFCSFWASPGLSSMPFMSFIIGQFSMDSLPICMCSIMCSIMAFSISARRASMADCCATI